MKRYFKFFASILLVLYFTSICCAQTKIDWKQIKNIPDTLDFKNVLLEHLLFKAAYQPVLDPAYRGAIYYDNSLERLRIYENGEWRDMSVTIASDSIGAPLTILGYLQASDIYASRSAHIGTNVYVGGGVNASGTSVFNYLKVNNAMKLPTVASKTLGVGSIYYNPTTNKLMVLDSSNNWKETSVDVDSAISATSTNPVQNKVIKAKLDDITASITVNVMQIDGRINTLNTNLLASLTAGLTDANNSALQYASSAVSISEGYAAGLATQTLNAAASYTLALRQYVDTQDAQTHTNALASASKLFVSLISTGSTNGTITMVKDNTFTDVPVKGLGDAAFTNVASISSSIGGNIPSQRPQPPIALGTMYYDTDRKVIRYWNGSSWRSIVEGVSGRILTGDAQYYSSWLTVGHGNERFIIQCGKSNTGNVSFLEEFKSGTTPIITLGPTAGPFQYYISNVSNTGFTLNRSSYEDTTSPDALVYWIAIGSVDDVLDN